MHKTEIKKSVTFKTETTIQKLKNNLGFGE